MLEPPDSGMSDPYRWGPGEVAGYLRSANLDEEYIRVFEREGVFGATLLALTKEELTSAPFNMRGFAPVRTVLGCISGLREQSKSMTAGHYQTAAAYPMPPPPPLFPLGFDPEVARCSRKFKGPPRGNVAPRHIPQPMPLAPPIPYPVFPPQPPMPQQQPQVVLQQPQRCQQPSLEEQTGFDLSQCTELMYYS